MKKIYIALLLLFCCTISFGQVRIKLDTFSRSYPAPVAVENDGNTTRVFVVCQTGLIIVLDSNGTKLDTFIDLRSKVQSSGEEGLLDMSFHPNYATNGYFYVYYTKKNTTDDYVFRYKVSANPNRASIDSEKQVLLVSHPTNTNHNGGCLKFRGGYLYVSTGDGGGGGDIPNNAQNKNILLGKILRLDVNHFDTTYIIPTTNPFYNQSNVKKEIWAMGLRNPWKYSFDRQTGDLWIGDVGQGNWEEVDFTPVSSTGGENYGWHCYEGNATYNTAGCLGSSNYVFPIYNYDHGSSGGIAIIGGFVYRGNKYNDLKGYYLFTDYGTANFWVTKKNDTTYTTTALGKVLTGANVSGFGEDIRGEQYATNVTNGVVYKIRELCSPFKLNLVNAVNPSCPNVLNGSIQMSSTASNGTVTYNWTPTGLGSTINNLGPGTYTVTATDAIGCVRKDTVVLHNADTLDFHLIQAKNPSCGEVHNGVIEMSGSGGTPPYHYIVFDAAPGDTNALNTDLPAGVFTPVIIDIHNCRAGDTITLHNADTLQIDVLNIKNPSCPGVTNGMIDITGDGGNHFYTYNWSNSALTGSNDNIGPGFYKVTVMDGDGCTAKDSFTLHNADTLQIHLVSLQNPSCPDVSNGSIQVSGSGGTPTYHYQWIGGDTLPTYSNLPAGSYSVLVSDQNNCQASTTYPLHNLDTLDRPHVQQRADTLYVPDIYASYQWYDGNTLLPSETNSYLKLVNQGNYNVRVTDANGCTGVSDSFGVFIFVKNSSRDIQQFNLFPNPAKDVLSLDLKFAAIKTYVLKITNTMGQILYEEKLQGKEISKSISVKSFAKGMYEFSIITEDGAMQTKNFVKE